MPPSTGWWPTATTCAPTSCRFRITAAKPHTLPDFVRHVRPRDGIISLGAGNPYGHPHPRVLSTLIEQQVRVWRTDVHGAVTVSTDGSTYEILTHYPAPHGGQASSD